MKHFNSYSDYYHNYCKTNHISEDFNFSSWIDTIEMVICRTLDIDSLLDIPDEPYVQYFEAGYTTEMVVDSILETN